MKDAPATPSLPPSSDPTSMILVELGRISSTLEGVKQSQSTMATELARQAATLEAVRTTAERADANATKALASQSDAKAEWESYRDASTRAITDALSGISAEIEGAMRGAMTKVAEQQSAVLAVNQTQTVAIEALDKETRDQTAMLLRVKKTAGRAAPTIVAVFSIISTLVHAWLASRGH